MAPITAWLVFIGTINYIMAINGELMERKCILIHCRYKDLEDYTEYSISEGESLINTFGATNLTRLVFQIREINPSSYISKGHIEKTISAIEEFKPDFIFWNHLISRRHQRELEQVLKKPIFDRARLILDIFRNRATSAEEKLQVELAYKEYERSRIVGAWSHLERQRGSISTVGGPGEKQLELDRRIIDNKIKVYKRKLQEIYKTRANQRKARSGIPLVSLVGYTNVGKTTLFNLLTKSSDLAENKLFATLAPHVKRFFLQDGDPPKYALLSDTVGFIRDFPSSLENAFAATLEELKYASLILHVRDLQMPFENRYSEAILAVLKKIGVTSPIIDVWNKCDLLTEACPDGISARNGTGIKELHQKIVQFLVPDQS